MHFRLCWVVDFAWWCLGDLAWRCGDWDCVGFGFYWLEPAFGDGMGTCLWREWKNLQCRRLWLGRDGKRRARVPQVRSGYVPKHRCATGLAPRNLLFPTWLPGTAHNFTTAGTARQ